jgi:hypothetical protein
MKKPLFFKIWFIWAAVSAVMLLPATVDSHPADQYFQAHHITVSDAGIEVKWSISPGPLMAPWIWQSADSDGNRHISEKEAREWWTANAPALRGELNGKPFDWIMGPVRWPDSITALQTGETPITARLT